MIYAGRRSEHIRLAECMITRTTVLGQPFPERTSLQIWRENPHCRAIAAPFTLRDLTEHARWWMTTATSLDR